MEDTNQKPNWFAITAACISVAIWLSWDERWFQRQFRPEVFWKKEGARLERAVEFDKASLREHDIEVAIFRQSAALKYQKLRSGIAPMSHEQAIEEIEIESSTLDETSKILMDMLAKQETELDNARRQCRLLTLAC